MPSGMLVLSIRTHGTSEDNNRKLGYSFESRWIRVAQALQPQHAQVARLPRTYRYRQNLLVIM